MEQVLLESGFDVTPGCLAVSGCPSPSLDTANPAVLPFQDVLIEGCNPSKARGMGLLDTTKKNLGNPNKALKLTARPLVSLTSGRVVLA